MVSSVSITLEGPADRVQRTLEFWMSLDDAAVRPVSSVAPARDVEGFVSGLTAEGARAVRAIAQASADGKPLPQPDLVRAIEAGSERELYGVLGGVGIHWGRWFQTPNPFRREGVRDGAHYEIESRLAGEILEALGLVTIVFTDVLGSVKKMNAMSDERWNELLQSYDEVLVGTLTQFGGRDVKSLGDGHMLVFSSPVDALRALQAVHQTIDGEIDGEPWELRAGVHAGEVVRQRDDFVGRDVALAARLADLGGANDIVVSAAVFERVSGLDEFSFEQMGEQEVRGFGEGHRCYRLKL